MRIDLMASQEAGDGVRDTHLSQTDVEYLPDFAELILNFTRAIGYTYINQIIFVKDDGNTVETLR
jgi:hypothetical protein